MKKIRLSEVVGGGYNKFWNYKGRYRAVKGGRASKKSVTMSLWVPFNMMKYPGSNTLVIRRYFNTHKDSTYTQLKWAINRLGVSHKWKATLSPLEITYIPTGQKILFRGLDDPQSITSITVENGHLTWVWFEEAFQILNEDDFNKIDMSIRGEVPDPLFKQITLTFNPWSEKHWLKERFFDTDDPNVLAMTTTYKCNEFLGEDDLLLFEDMKKRNPRRYNIEGLGNWGIAQGLVYENWKEEEFDYRELTKKHKAYFGLDFGYTADPTTLICLILDEDNKRIYIFDEHYEKGMLNTDIADMLKYKGYSKEVITADGAEPKSIDELKNLGIRRVKGAKRGPDSVINGIQKVQQYDIIVHPKCVNTIVELNNYVWSENKEGRIINKPIDDYDHLMDALRYAIEDINKSGWLV